MLIPRRFPGPLAITIIIIINYFGDSKSIFSIYDLNGLKLRTFNWVLFKMLLVLLHCSRAARMNELTEPLQVCYGFVHQLRVSGNGFQPGQKEIRIFQNCLKCLEPKYINCPLNI